MKKKQKNCYRNGQQNDNDDPPKELNVFFPSALYGKI